MSLLVVKATIAYPNKPAKQSGWYSISSRISLNIPESQLLQVYKYSHLHVLQMKVLAGSKFTNTVEKKMGKKKREEIIVI